MQPGVRRLATLLLLTVVPTLSLADDMQRKVVVQAPSKVTLTRYFYSTGTVAAVASVDLVGRVSGTLEKVNKKDGAAVKQGEVLFVIEQEPYQIAVQSAQAALDQQNASLTQAVENLTRQQDLLSKRAAAESAVESAIAQAATSKALVAAADAALRSAKLNLSYTEVKSPLDGILSARAFEQGAYINAAQTPKLASVIQPDPIRIDFTANQKELIQIRKAMEERKIKLADLGTINVEIGLPSDDDYAYTGKLDYIAPDLDATTGTIALRAVADNKSKLFSPGMFVRLRIPVTTKAEALAIPDRAVSTSQEGMSVLAIGKDNTVETRLVTLGQPIAGGLREVVKGLAAADRVVVEGMDNVQAGDVATVVDKLQ
jgi:RND family efflux transporter MFP subunit